MCNSQSTVYPPIKLNSEKFFKHSTSEPPNAPPGRCFEVSYSKEEIIALHQEIVNLHKCLAVVIVEHKRLQSYIIPKILEQEKVLKMLVVKLANFPKKSLVNSTS